jgi:antitoxin component YwqK of YwqJK toxin-antitoxin module
MKRYHITILTLLTLGFSLTRCVNNDTKTAAHKWYEDTKAEILKQSNLTPDSTTLILNEDSSFKKEHYFSAGHEFLLKGYNKDVLRLEIRYSNNGDFELRREICENGNYAFEGIVYKSNFYGLSTWRYCDKSIDHQGIRYNGQKIGIWKKFDEKGKLTEEIDYKNIEKLDSMPTISK